MSNRRPRRGSLGAALSALVGLASTTAPAHAASWTLDRSLECRLQADDNPNLSPRPGAVANTLSLTGALVSALQTPSQSLRVDAAATAWWTGSGTAQDRVEGRLGVLHTWRLETQEWRLGFQAQQDTIYPTAATTTNAATASSAADADLGLGRGQRRSLVVNTQYSHAFSERMSAQLQAQLGTTQYGSDLPGATNYRSSEASAALSWRASERNTLSIQLGKSHFNTRPLSSSTANTVTITLGASRALSEASSITLSLGGYRSLREASQNITLCPLPAEFCSLGLVTPVLVQLRGTRRDSGLQYSASYTMQALETTAVRVAAERQQAPSGAGVVLRSDRLQATVEHAWSERTGLDASYLHTRSAYTGLAGSPRPQLQLLQAALARRLDEGLNLRAGWQWTRSGEAASRQSARANQVYVTLRLDGRRLNATL